MQGGAGYSGSVPRAVRILVPIAIGVLAVLTFNPITYEAWWLRSPEMPPDFVARVWCVDAAILTLALIVAFVAARARPRAAAYGRRQWAFAAVLVILGLLVSAAVLEVGLRLSGTRAAFPSSLRRELGWRARHAGTSGAPRPEASYAYSPTLGWELRPNVRTELVTSNSRGIRGSREYAEAPPPGTHRVLCLGDSFTFGPGLRDDETMPARLEAALNADGTARWEALNLGVEGYGTDQQWLYFADRGLRYRADVVVLSFFEQNLERNVMSFRDYAKPYFTLVDGRLAVRNVPIPSPPELLARPPVIPPLRVVSLVDTLAHEFRMSMSFEDLARTPAGAVTVALLDAIRGAAVTRGARFVLASIPRPILPRASDTEALLARWAARTGTPFVNLRTAYLGLPEGERKRLYRGHWTPHGADVTARFIAAELRRLGQEKPWVRADPPAGTGPVAVPTPAVPRRPERSPSTRGRRALRPPRRCRRRGAGG